MEKVYSALEEIKQINNSYERSNEPVSKLLDEMAYAKICTPIIGRFSSGKSALVNTLLGYSKKILKEDITPETAIPAEIVYTDSDEAVTILNNDNTSTRISVGEYRDYTADANTVKSARIQLQNEFLQKIPDVMIVDMPGFESGFEIHNKAIDNNLPQSLAYIIAIPADDLIVRNSVGNILKELCLHDMPLCVVITKYDKRNKDEFETALEKMKESLKRYVGDRKITFCITSTFYGDAEELEDFLRKIQEQSQKILAAKYSKNTLAIVEDTESYLKTTLNSSQLSESELDENEEKLKKQFSSLNSKFSNEQQDFESEMDGCVAEIRSDVEAAMKAELETLVSMVLNKTNINEHLTYVIRNAVTLSIQKRFVPKVNRYLKRVAKTINDECIENVNIVFSFDESKLGNGIVANVASVFFAITMPLIAPLIAWFIKMHGDKKREQAKEEIRSKLLTETFPQALNDITTGVEMTIKKQVEAVNTTIGEELKSQQETLEKAMADVRKRINDEKEEKERLIGNIKNDLERIEEIKDELR